MAKKPGGHADSQPHTETHAESTDDQTTAAATPVPDNDQVAELTADLQRLQAEFQNYKRRVETERGDAMAFVRAQVVRQFLSVRDTFDAEAAHRPAGLDPQWAASIDAIRAQFDSVMKNLGVERFESVGQAFDPHLHEAVSRDGEGETVTAELQAGYKMGDVVLRPAMVKVG